MAKLYFRYGAMGSSKTANAIMVRHNYSEMGQRALMIKPAVDQRDGETIVSSRSGLQCPCIYMEHLTDETASKYDCLIVDEANFLSPDQVRQLVHIVDDLNVPVIAYGLRADFRGELFPGSAALLAWADTIEEVKTVCWCGKKATFNTRVIDGKVVKEGAQVLLGGNDSYISLCRRHWQEGNLGSRAESFQKPLIRELTTPEEKRQHWDLLLLADAEEHMILRYLDRSRMFALGDDHETFAIALVAPREDGQLELMNLATAPAHQRNGYATKLIEYIVKTCRNQCDWLYVGTAFPGLYERWGFAYAYTIKDFFVTNYHEPVIDEGRQCIDMIVYRRPLAGE